MDLLQAALKTFCSSRSSTRSKLSRQKPGRSNRSAQLSLTAFAFIYQLSGFGLLMHEAVAPQPVMADPPMAGDATGSATSTGTGSFAIGVSATTSTHLFSTAVGFFTQATGTAATALGYGAIAAQFGTAVGPGARANEQFGAAIGSDATANGDSAFAAGRQSVASGTNAAAIGRGAGCWI